MTIPYRTRGDASPHRRSRFLVSWMTLFLSFDLLLRHIQVSFGISTNSAQNYLRNEHLRCQGHCTSDCFANGADMFNYGKKAQAVLYCAPTMFHDNMIHLRQLRHGPVGGVANRSRTLSHTTLSASRKAVMQYDSVALICSMRKWNGICGLWLR